MPCAVAALSELGVCLPAGTGRPFRGFNFCVPGTVARGAFTGACGIGLRRTELHALLAERAQAMGVDLRWNSPVVLHPDGTVSVGGERCSVRWIIGADGQRSAVRRAAGLEPRRESLPRFGFRQHFRCTPWTDHVEIHWAQGAQAYVTAVGEDQICVAVVSTSPQQRIGNLGQVFPEIAARLNGACPLSTERGAVTTCRRVPRLVKGNVLLIGEAAGSVDAITGYGLAIAFQQAIALRDAFSAGHPGWYAAPALALQRKPRVMSEMLTFLGKHPRLCRRIITASAKEAAVFTQMAAWHSGTRSAVPCDAAAVMRLGWRLARA